MRCKATSSRGEQCRCEWGINPDNGLCYSHDPTREEQRREGQRKGQAQSSHVRRRTTFRTVPAGKCPPMPQTAQDAADWAAWLTLATVTGEVDARTSKEAYGAIRTFLMALDKSELQQRIVELEALVKKAKKAGVL